MSQCFASLRDLLACNPSMSAETYLNLVKMQRYMMAVVFLINELATSCISHFPGTTCIRQPRPFCTLRFDYVCAVRLVIMVAMSVTQSSLLFHQLQEEFVVERRPERQVPVPDKVQQRNRRMFGALLGHLDGAECGTLACFGQFLTHIRPWWRVASSACRRQEKKFEQSTVLKRRKELEQHAAERARLISIQARQAERSRLFEARRKDIATKRELLLQQNMKKVEPQTLRLSRFEPACVVRKVTAPQLHRHRGVACHRFNEGRRCASRESFLCCFLVRATTCVDASLSTQVPDVFRGVLSSRNQGWLMQIRCLHRCDIQIFVWHIS